MQDNAMQQLKGSLKFLSDALSQGNNYVQMEDLVVVVQAIRSSMESLKENISEVDERLGGRIKELLDAVHSIDEKINDNANFTKGLGDRNDKSQELIDETRKQLEDFKKNFEDAISNNANNFGALKSKADQLEFNLSSLSTESEDDSTEEEDDKLEVMKSDFDKTVEDLKKEISTLKESIVLTRSATGGSRRVFQPYVERFTTQTNGSKKVFYLKRAPLRTETIKVWGTDFPIILDPTVDFTVANRTLTLSASVPAPSTGATLIIEYFA